jgi:hypothetical protein
MDKQTQMGSMKVWLPDGVWTDFFSGHTYRGNHSVTINRRITEQAVLAKAGAIVPLAVRKDNETTNPEAFKVMAFPGGEGSYTLFEDGGDGYEFENGKKVATTFAMKNCDGGMSFAIHAEGDMSLVPAERTYEICFRGFEPFEVETDIPHTTSYDKETRTLSVKLEAVTTAKDITVKMVEPKMDTHKDAYERVRDFLIHSEVPVRTRNLIDAVCREPVSVGEMVQSLHTLDISPAIFGVVCELMFS